MNHVLQCAGFLSIEYSLCVIRCKPGESGCAGVAVIRGVLAEEDPGGVVREMLESWGNALPSILAHEGGA